MTSHRENDWDWSDTTADPVPWISKRGFNLLLGGLVVAGGIVAYLLWPEPEIDVFQVTNRCSEVIYVEIDGRGREVPPTRGFSRGVSGDLELSIGVPGGPLVGPRTFEPGARNDWVTVVDVSGELCPK